MAAASRRNAPGPFPNDPNLKRSVTKRMDTFLSLHDARVGNVSASDVADCGYAYDRVSKSVRCVWCGAYVFDWERLDSVSVIQQLHNETCPKGPPPDEETPPDDQASGVEDQLEGGAQNTEIDLSRREALPPSVLRDENERMREERRCKQCNRAQVETLFLPCRHLVACEACADQVDDCFVCDTKILGTVRIYMM